MIVKRPTLWLGLLGCCAAGLTGAQDNTAPPPAAGAAAASIAPTPTPTPAPAAAPPAGPTARQSGKSAQIEAGEPRVDTSARAAAVATPRAKNASDRVDLDPTTVTGNQELPKVMYIVPWKKSDIGDLGGKPMNSLLDEVLAPVDRDVFRREVIYYQAIKADATQKGPPGGPPEKQGEK
jgi:hypothetical protein